MSEKRFSKGEAIRFGWKTMNENLGFFVILTLIIFGVTWVPFIFAETTKETMPIVSALISLGGNILSIFVGMGLIKIFLRFCDSEQGTFEDLFAYSHLFFRYLGAAILMGLAVMGGIICLIIPGVILSLKLQFFSYLIIDKNVGAVESLKKSYAMTKGVWGELFVLGLLLALINIAGLLCLGIGLFATIPTSYLATAYVYRKLVTQYEVTASVAQTVV